MALRVATDVGGTFTDLVVFDETAQAVRAAKVPSTPPAFAEGVLDAIVAGGVDLADASFFVHGTTVVINAITERKGARVALVTTRGFRDVIEIARGNRRDMYNLRYRKPTPFVPRRLHFEATERVDVDGKVLVPMSEGELEEIAEACRHAEVEAVAICFLHSYVNPTHERRAAERLADLLPDISICCSSDVTRQWREYERSNTAALNAYVQPVVQRYLDDLAQRTARRGLRATGYVMQSSGGTATFPRARRLPINLVESGPAGGIIGAAFIGRLIGELDVIHFDVGGTTAKCSLIEGGSPKTTVEYWIERSEHDAGYPISVPVTDVVEIGAGGGSIAWVDDAGALHVGPQSAGAEPGPVCYGRGGHEPTVTDAELVAGVLNPDYFLGGQLRVEPGLAVEAFDRLGRRLGLTAREAASGVVRLANAKMISALRLVSVRRGYDPRDFVLVACGGGGAMHAAALGAELRVKKVVIPPFPGYFSAWGMLVTDPRVDLVRTRVCRTADAGSEIEGVFSDLEQEAARELDEGATGRRGTPRFERHLEMRYVGQEHTVVAPVTNATTIAEIEAAFHRAHEQLYTFRLDDPIEIVNFHATATLPTDHPAPARLPDDGRSVTDARKGVRAVDFDVGGVLDCAVYERDLLPRGARLAGPLIVEEPSTTTLVHPGQHLEVDEWGNLVIPDPGSSGALAESGAP